MSFADDASVFTQIDDFSLDQDTPVPSVRSEVSIQTFPSKSPSTTRSVFNPNLEERLKRFAQRNRSKYESYSSDLRQEVIRENVQTATRGNVQQATTTSDEPMNETQKPKKGLAKKGKNHPGKKKKVRKKKKNAVASIQGKLVKTFSRKSMSRESSQIDIDPTLKLRILKFAERRLTKDGKLDVAENARSAFMRISSTLSRQQIDSLDTENLRRSKGSVEVVEPESKRDVGYPTDNQPEVRKLKVKRKKKKKKKKRTGKTRKKKGTPKLTTSNYTGPIAIKKPKELRRSARLRAQGMPEGNGPIGVSSSANTDIAEIDKTADSAPRKISMEKLMEPVKRLESAISLMGSHGQLLPTGENAASMTSFVASIPENDDENNVTVGDGNNNDSDSSGVDEDDISMQFKDEDDISMQFKDEDDIPMQFKDEDDIPMQFKDEENISVQLKGDGSKQDNNIPTMQFKDEDDNSVDSKDEDDISMQLEHEDDISSVGSKDEDDISMQFKGISESFDTLDESFQSSLSVQSEAGDASSVLHAAGSWLDHESDSEEGLVRLSEVSEDEEEARQWAEQFREPNRMFLERKGKAAPRSRLASHRSAHARSRGLSQLSGKTASSRKGKHRRNDSQMSFKSKLALWNSRPLMAFRRLSRRTPAARGGSSLGSEADGAAAALAAWAKNSPVAERLGGREAEWGVEGSDTESSEEESGLGEQQRDEPQERPWLRPSGNQARFASLFRKSVRNVPRQTNTQAAVPADTAQGLPTDQKNPPGGDQKGTGSSRSREPAQQGRGRGNSAASQSSAVSFSSKLKQLIKPSTQHHGNVARPNINMPYVGPVTHSRFHKTSSGRWVSRKSKGSAGESFETEEDNPVYVQSVQAANRQQQERSRLKKAQSRQSFGAKLSRRSTRSTIPLEKFADMSNESSPRKERHQRNDSDTAWGLVTKALASIRAYLPKDSVLKTQIPGLMDAKENVNSKPSFSDQTLDESTSSRKALPQQHVNTGALAIDQEPNVKPTTTYTKQKSMNSVSTTSTSLTPSASGSFQEPKSRKTGNNKKEKATGELSSGQHHGEVETPTTNLNPLVKLPPPADPEVVLRRILHPPKRFVTRKKSKPKWRFSTRTGWVAHS